jgi:membrane-associated phospholipid phosphatase
LVDYSGIRVILQLRTAAMHTTLPARAATRRFWAWPDARVWWTYAWVAAAGALWFLVVYGGADYVTSRRLLRVPIHFEAELRIPFVAAAAWVYMSIYALFLMAPLVLRSPREVMALGASLAAVTATAGLTFLLLPAELAFPPPAGAIEPGPTAFVYGFADRLNLRYNLLPSLHVALSVACVAAYAPRAPAAGRIALWAWAVAIALSTVLTHFHHLLDAITGFLLGALAGHVAHRRMLQHDSADAARSRHGDDQEPEGHVGST